MRFAGAGATRCALRHVPAGLSAARLLATPWIVGRALRGARGQCCVAIAGSVMIDLADGMLARRIGDPCALQQQRRIDGVADAVFVVAAPLCAYRLRPTLLREERGAIALVSLCQAASLLVCYARFGCLPRYHTAAYKWASGTLGVALAGRVAGGRLSLGFRPAMAAVAVAHLEALAISLLLDAYHTPVSSLRAALNGGATGGMRPQSDREPQRRSFSASDSKDVMGHNQTWNRPASTIHETSHAASRTMTRESGSATLRPMTRESGSAIQQAAIGVGRADLHLHTTASDGLASPEAVLEQAVSLGLDVIAVTDHDTVEGAWRMRELAAQRGYPIEVIVGIEATTARGVHLLGLFVERPLTRMYQPVEAAIDAIVAQGGLCLAPHPLSPLTPSLGRRAIDRLLVRGSPLVGVETHNPTPAGRIVARRVAWHNARWQLAGFGGSDAHFLPHIGSAYTLFPGQSAADLRRALLARATTGYLDGAPHDAVPLRDYLRQVERSLVRSPARKLARAIRARR